jgi:hypothetical protein
MNHLSKKRHIRITTWENHHGQIKLRHVLPLAKTVDDLCRLFYRTAAKPMFWFERMGQMNGHYVWIRTQPLVRL